MPWRRMGEWMYTSTFFYLCTSWRWVSCFTPHPLNPRGKSLLYPLDRWFGGPQIRYGRCGEEKILDPTGTRTPTPGPSSLLPIAIPTTLSRLQMKSILFWNTMLILNCPISCIMIRGWNKLNWIDLQVKCNLKNLCAKIALKRYLQNKYRRFRFLCDLLLQNNTDFAVPSFVLPYLNSLARF
jgi:hypothetical protein